MIKTTDSHAANDPMIPDYYMLWADTWKVDKMPPNRRN